MSKRIDALTPGTFLLDGTEVEFGHGESILQAATRAGHYIPHLCWHPEFGAVGSCRICTVKVNGRTGASCTVLAASGQQATSWRARRSLSGPTPRIAAVSLRSS